MLFLMINKNLSNDHIITNDTKLYCYADLRNLNLIIIMKSNKHVFPIIQ